MSCAVNNTDESLSRSPPNCASCRPRRARQAWQAEFPRQRRRARTVSGDAAPAGAAEVDQRVGAFAASLLQCRLESEPRAGSGRLRLARRGGRIDRVAEQEALHADRAAAGEKLQL